jgi:hypothetical protein
VIAGEKRRRLEARAAELEADLKAARAAADHEKQRLAGEMAALERDLQEARKQSARVSR